MAGLLNSITKRLSSDSDPNKPSKKELEAKLKAQEDAARQARLNVREEEARARCAFEVV